MYGQLSRVPLANLPLDKNLLLQLKSETDLERLLKSNTVWTDPETKVAASALVDLTVDTEDSNLNFIDALPEPIVSTNNECRHLHDMDVMDTYDAEGGTFNQDEETVHSYDSQAGGFIRDEDTVHSYDSQAGGFFRDEESVPLSLNSQPPTKSFTEPGK